MKKVILAFAIVSVSLVACNNGEATTETPKVDSIVPKMDSVAAKVDSVAAKIDSVATKVDSVIKK
jgi:outer membrane murein-binding lipoprotein Lpp